MAKIYKNFWIYWNRKKAKNNSFLLIGNTGIGKSEIVNLLFSKKVAKAGMYNLITWNSNIYFQKILEKKNISLIDTPGFCIDVNYDCKSVNQKIFNFLNKNKIMLKGFLFIITDYTRLPKEEALKYYLYFLYCKKWIFIINMTFDHSNSKRNIKRYINLLGEFLEKKFNIKYSSFFFRFYRER